MVAVEESSEYNCNDKNSARTQSPESSGENDYDAADEFHVSTAFKTHLKSFTYTSSSTISNSLSDVRSTEQPRSQSTRSKMTDAESTGDTAADADSSGTLRSSNRKRTLEDFLTGKTASPAATNKKRSTTKQRSAADPHNPINKLVDSLRSDLTLVFIGLNPGLTTAATGHAYAHASNLFWKLLNWSGVTPVQHDPSETHDLMDLYSIGNTNICMRPTRSGDGLSKEELVEGAGILEEKITKHNPEAVCIVGKGIWDVIYKAKTGNTLKKGNFQYGWQDEKLWLGRKKNKDGTLKSPGSRTFVATTTSGLAASMSTSEKLEVWKPLGEWVQERRKNGVEEEVTTEIKTEENLEDE